MKSLTFKILTALVIILSAQLAQGQTNSCSGAAPTADVMNPKTLSVELPEHTALNPQGVAVVTNYNLVVMQGTNTISSTAFTKDSFSLQPGTPSNCYKLAIPGLAGVQNNQLYKLGLIANGPAGSSSIGLTSQSFFLQGVPAAPTNLRLAIINMLSKLWDKTLSTVSSKPWFKPIGR